MKSIFLILATTMILGLGLAARAQDAGTKKDAAPQKAAAAASAVAKPAPTSTSVTAAPAPVAVPAPVPAPAPAVAAAPAQEKEAINVCSYTGAIGRLYEDLTRDAKEFTAQWQASVAALKQREAEIQARLEKKNQEIEEKQLDTSKAAKGELKILKKAEKQLSKDLATVQKQTKREVDTAMTRMAEMYKRHLDSIKAKYKEVEGRIRTAQDQ